MPTPGPLELVIILVIALLILGPGRLPDVGSALGKSLREFRKASSDIQESVKVDTSPLPPDPAPAPPVAPPGRPGQPGRTRAGGLRVGPERGAARRDRRRPGARGVDQAARLRVHVLVRVSGLGPGDRHGRRPDPGRRRAQPEPTAGDRAAETAP